MDNFYPDPSGPVIRLPAPTSGGGGGVGGPAPENCDAVRAELAIAQRRLTKADELATAVKEFYDDWQEGDFRLPPVPANAATYMNGLVTEYRAAG